MNPKELKNIINYYESTEPTHRQTERERETDNHP
jgi:hypothetical protein